MMDLKFAGKPTPLPAQTHLDQMPDNPTRRAHHRRALSETFFLDDILLDDNVVPPTPLPPNGPPTPPKQGDVDRPPAHLRSLSVDADFFEGLMFDGPPSGGGEVSTRRKHRHSNSMDGYYSSVMSFEADSHLKKAMAADRLAELSLIDPKRAKRILANRQSAARSKERKVCYTSELERKVQTLQTEATTLTAQITLLQKDTSGLTSENKELKLKLQALEQQALLRDALNEALRNEVQRLKIAAGEIPAGNGNNRGFSSQSPTFNHYFGNQNQQQMQQNQTHQPNNSQASGQSQLAFRDFNQRGG